MTNIVDVSKDTIDAEWEALAAGAGLDFSEDPASEPQPEPGREEAEPGGDNLPGAPAGPTDAESIAMATVIIRGGLDVALSMMAGVSVPGDKLDRAAETWAVVICKYYKGGIFAFLERFKEELAAMGATLALVGAVAAAKREKLERAAKAKEARQGEAEAEAPGTEATSRRVDRGEGGE